MNNKHFSDNSSFNEPIQGILFTNTASEFWDEEETHSMTEIIEQISNREWTYPPYSIQSWGSWLHRIAPYVGRIKPSFASFLIKYISKPGELILDPFCGIGTIPTEAALRGRRSVGIDLNPYAYYVALAKTDNQRNKDELLKYLDNIEINTSLINLDRIPEWVREYYNQDTLREILFLIDKLKVDKQYFILGCLVGISQGHRPGHLSKPVAWTLPYKPKPDDKGEYRAVIPRLKQKIERTYLNDFSNIADMKIYLHDARSIPLENNSVDHIISSPPYYDTLNYVGSHRLRLAIIGYYDEKLKKELGDSLIQRFDDYLEEMKRVFFEMKRVLKENGYCVLVLGDCHKNKQVLNTALTVKPLAEECGFSCHAIIQDEIPMNKSVQKHTKIQKHDRIMILTKS